MAGAIIGLIIAGTIFLAAVLAGGLSMLFPPVQWIRAMGTIGLGAGLVLMAVAVSLELVEGIMARDELEVEIADLDEEARPLS